MCGHFVEESVIFVEQLLQSSHPRAWKERMVGSGYNACKVYALTCFESNDPIFPGSITCLK
jgi:hypothetical protein